MKTKGACPRRMDMTTFRHCRHDISNCVHRANDALFNTIDALLTQSAARSCPDMSHSLWCERTWSSLDEAFQDGRIDEHGVRDVVRRSLPIASSVGTWVWRGMDTRSITRPEAITAADRTAHHGHPLPECTTPITCGWHCSTVVALPPTPSRWTSMLDQHRVSSKTTAADVAYAHLARLTEHLPTTTLAVFDRGDDGTWFWCRCSGLGIGFVNRRKRTRCFSRVAPEPPGKTGAPRNDGATRHPKDSATHGDPSGSWSGTEEQGRPVSVTWWTQVPVTQARWLEVTVLRVVRPHATNAERDPRIRWGVWMGDASVTLAESALGSVVRFSHDHGSRCDTPEVLWEKPRVRPPEPCERCSHMVAMVHHHVVLARDLVDVERRPWENTQRMPTPQQVRRGMDTVFACLGTPARPPQPRGTSKGRKRGATVGNAERFPAIRQTPKMVQRVPS